MTEYSLLKFIINSSVLQNIINNIFSVVEKKSIVPLMSNILLNVNNGVLSISAFNIDMSIIEHSKDLEIIAEGNITVNASLFSEIVTKIEAKVTIEVIENAVENDDTHEEEKKQLLIIKTANSEFSLATLPANLFPENRNENYEKDFIIQAKDLHYLLQDVFFAVSGDRSKKYLNGVFLHFDDKQKLRTVATDGHRLACCISKENFTFRSDDLAVIVPKKTVFEIIKLTKINNTAAIKFYFNKNDLKFVIGEITLYSKVLNGNFPNYQQIIKESNKYIITVDRLKLKNSISRVSLLSPEKTKTIILAVDFANNYINISAYSNEYGSANENIDLIVKQNNNHEIEIQKIGINALYLLEILSHLTHKDLDIEFNGSIEPIRFIDYNYQENIYILMPVRI